MIKQNLADSARLAVAWLRARLVPIAAGVITALICVGVAAAVIVSANNRAEDEPAPAAEPMAMDENSSEPSPLTEPPSPTEKPAQIEALATEEPITEAVGLSEAASQALSSTMADLYLGTPHDFELDGFQTMLIYRHPEVEDVTVWFDFMAAEGSGSALPGAVWGPVDWILTGLPQPVSVEHLVEVFGDSLILPEPIDDVGEFFEPLWGWAATAEVDGFRLLFDLDAVDSPESHSVMAWPTDTWPLEPVPTTQNAALTPSNRR